MNKKKSGVESVDKALSILDCFVKPRQELSLTELSNSTNNYKSTTLRLCESLEKFNFLEKDINKKYKLGNGIDRLYSVYDNSFNYREEIQQELHSLCKETNETVSFFIKQKNLRVCILNSIPNKFIKHVTEIGVPKPLKRGASGKIVSVYNNIAVENYKLIRKRGYQIELEVQGEEFASIATPLFLGKKFLGAIGITGHISNFDKKNCLKFVKLLKHSCSKLEKKLV
tara:strand:+ start:335 stop:1015 length:681 start_codon:yes stop_codon:yes gene_type:complete